MHSTVQLLFLKNLLAIQQNTWTTKDYLLENLGSNYGFFTQIIIKKCQANVKLFSPENVTPQETNHGLLLPIKSIQVQSGIRLNSYLLLHLLHHVRGQVYSSVFDPSQNTIV